MKITKFSHSCLLVEMPEPISRTALFDPGVYSEGVLKIEDLQFLDDIIITHSHFDHMSVPLIKQLVGKFPSVHITAPSDVVSLLAAEGVAASDQPSPNIAFFDAPHEQIRPYREADAPEELGIHYFDMLSDPGDSHSFSESKAILALPVQAPWGSAVGAVRVALAVRPQHILPIHDWHWSDAARASMYDALEARFAEEGIIFHKLVDGVPVVIDVQPVTNN